MEKSSYSEIYIIKSFKKLGLKRGDNIFVGTSLGMFGLPKKVKTQNQLNKIFYSSLIKVIGVKGNMFVPTYSFTFGVPHWKNFLKKEKKFQRKIDSCFTKQTKSEVGPFTNFFLKQKNVIRSQDPMVSVSGSGPLIKKIFKNLPHTSYGKDCLFERLLKLKNLKILSLGLGTGWAPFFHYVENLANVPYRFKKNYSGRLFFNNKLTYINWEYHSRILDERTITSGYRISKISARKKIWKSIDLGRSRINICNYQKFFKFTLNKVKKNKWYLAKGPRFTV